MKRRTLVLAAGLLPLGVLAGCGTVGRLVDANLAQVADDVQSIAAGAKAILPQLGALGVDAATLADVSGIVDDIQTAATAIATVYTEENARPIVEQVAGYVLTLANVVAAIPGVPPIVKTIIAAAQVLVPAIEKVLGIAGVAAPRGTAPMTPDQARTILRAYGQAR
jgi:hypothetical protein